MTPLRTPLKMTRSRATFFGLLSLLLMTSAPAAILDCHQVFSNSPRTTIDSTKLNKLYADNLLTGSQPRLRFDWIQHSPYLETLTLENTQMKDPYHWVNSGDPRLPVVRTHDGYGTIEGQNMFRPDYFYEALYRQYTEKIDPAMIEELKKNRDWPLDRMDYGVVRDKKIDGVIRSSTDYGMKQEVLGVIVGTLRVFNGIPARQIVVVGAGGKTPLIIQRDPQLPFERIMDQRGIITKTSAALTEERTRNHKAEIFEIGKFSVSKDHPERAQALAALELFLLANYFEKYPDGMFYVHVNTRAHLVHYHRRYKLEKIEVLETGKDPVTGEPKTEWILAQKGSEIAQALRGIYGL